MRNFRNRQTFNRNRSYVWNHDVILNHMTWRLSFLIRQFPWRQAKYRLYSSSPKMFRPERHLAGNGSHLVLFWSLLIWYKMAVPIGNGRYYKLFPGNSPPKRLLIDEISEPGLLSSAFVQGLCKYKYKVTFANLLLFLNGQSRVFYLHENNWCTIKLSENKNVQCNVPCKWCLMGDSLSRKRKKKTYTTWFIRIVQNCAPDPSIKLTHGN